MPTHASAPQVPSGTHCAPFLHAVGVLWRACHGPSLSVGAMVVQLKRPTGARRIAASILACAALAAQGSWAGHQTPVTAIAISNSQALAFGKFAAGSGGSVAVGPSGARSATGSVVLLSSSGGSAAQFTISGDANFTYSISLPANGTVVLTNSGGQTMSLSNFSSSPIAFGQLSGIGRQTVSVGATLNVANNQPTGAYTGTFQVTVNYD